MSVPIYGTIRRIMRSNPKVGLKARHDLRQKEPTRPLAILIKGGSGPLNIVRSSEPDKPIPEVLTLQQDEHHEDCDDAGRGQRRQKRCDDRNQRSQCARIRLLHFDGNRRASISSKMPGTPFEHQRS
jgi:hypothetical protein